MMWSGSRSEMYELSELSELSEPGGVVLVLQLCGELCVCVSMQGTFGVSGTRK